jgi:hypothetical protein
VPEAAAGRAVHVQLVVDGEVVRLTLSIVSYVSHAERRASATRGCEEQPSCGSLMIHQGGRDLRAEKEGRSHVRRLFPKTDLVYSLILAS